MATQTKNKSNTKNISNSKTTVSKKVNRTKKDVVDSSLNTSTVNNTLTKIYTKTDEEFKPKRELAQKLTFAQLQELIQRNVTKGVNKSFVQYTRDLLDQYTANPLNSIDNLREVSRFLTRVSMIYKQMISYFSTMPLYTYNITPIFDYTQEVDSEKTLKNYQKVLKSFNSFNMFKELSNVVSTTIRDGFYVGYMFYSEKDGIFLMPLDQQYCRIYGKTSNGEWIVFMNAAYFDQGNNKDFIYGVNNDGVGIWPDVFIEGYETYKNDGRDYQWFRLPPENTLCMISSTDDEFYMPLPYFLPLFKSLLQLLDTENLIAAKNEIENYKLILLKIPLMQDGDDINDFAIDLDIVLNFQRLLEEIVPDGIGIGTTPCETDTISFDKSTSTSDTDALQKAMNSLFSNAGINQLVVSSGDSSNANGLKYSIANDLGKMSVYIRRLESWLNYFIKTNIAEGFKLQIFDQTQYNRQDFINEKKSAAELGSSKMDYLCALGDTPYIAYNKLRFEAEVLNVQKFMMPLQSTYTQSGNNTGGAPTKDETELSPEGQATRDSGKNDDKGNK